MTFKRRFHIIHTSEDRETQYRIPQNREEDDASLNNHIKSGQSDCGAVRRVHVQQHRQR